MLKIQYGTGGFFAGVFLGFLIGLVEMRIINGQNHSTILFLTIAITVIVCGIIGLGRGISMANKKMKAQ